MDYSDDARILQLNRGDEKHNIVNILKITELLVLILSYMD
jgi:hypothetical protein